MSKRKPKRVLTAEEILALKQALGDKAEPNLVIVAIGEIK